MWQYNSMYDTGDELMHYGVPGMKWGRRKARPISTGSYGRSKNSTIQTSANRRTGTSSVKGTSKTNKSNLSEQQKAARKAKAKKAAKIGAVAAGTVLAAYGGYKLSKFVKTSNINYRIDQAEKEDAAIYRRAYNDFMSRTGGKGTFSYRGGDNTRIGTARANSDNFAKAALNTYNYYRNKR